MRVQFLRGTALGGVGNDAHPGDERDLPEWQARQYIAAGRARMVHPEQQQGAATPALPGLQAAEVAPRARTNPRKAK